MYNEQDMKEVETLIKNKHDLNTSMMAQISGIKGKQFGKDVYATLLPFKDLMKFLTVFPEVQRELNKRKVSSIKRYTLSGVELLEEAKEAMRFFTGITCTARGFVFYDENTSKIAIDTHKSKLSINDGQHRFRGINEAIEKLTDRMNKTKDVKEKDHLAKMLHELKHMTIPMTIFGNLTEAEEKQLFSDSNNLSQRPSRSATIRLAQTDVISRMSREISEENKYLIHYGVEYDKMSIHKSNNNTILLTSIYSGTKQMFWELLKHNKDIINDKSYSHYKKIANITWTNIFQSLPNDIDVKGKYVTDKSFAMKAICRFINDCRHVKHMDDDQIFEAIKNINWETDYSYWKNYRAIESKTGLLTFGSSGTQGYAAILDALNDNLKEVVSTK